MMIASGARICLFFLHNPGNAMALLRNYFPWLALNGLTRAITCFFYFCFYRCVTSMHLVQSTRTQELGETAQRPGCGAGSRSSHHVKGGTHRHSEGLCSLHQEHCRSVIYKQMFGRQFADTCLEDNDKTASRRNANF